jgi:hypothetical protein
MRPCCGLGMPMSRALIGGRHRGARQNPGRRNRTPLPGSVAAGRFFWFPPFGERSAFPPPAGGGRLAAPGSPSATLSHPASGTVDLWRPYWGLSWYRSYSNENRKFNDNDLMGSRLARSTTFRFSESDRRCQWPPRRRPIATQDGVTWVCLRTEDFKFKVEPQHRATSVEIPPHVSAGGGQAQ